MKRFFTISLAILLVSSSLAAQRISKRLILKDGSYQPAREWQITGERVRYYSTERSTWEEIPYALIDWPATEKYEKERISGQSAPKPTAEDLALEEELLQPEVAPGLRLPDIGGVYLLDAYQGRPGLVEITQSGGKVNKQMGRNTLRAILIPVPLGTKQTVEVLEPKAKVQAHSTKPELYVNLEGNDQDINASALTPGRYTIVRAQPKGKNRIIANVDVNLVGKAKEKRNAVATNVQIMKGGWIKVTPRAELTPGEYALVEVLEGEQMNLYVWDFGVDLSAPANADVVAQPKDTSTGTTAAPVVTKRPK